MSSRNQAVIKLCHEIIFISVDFFFLWKKSFNFAEACFVATVIVWPTHKQLSKWRKQNTSQTIPPCLHHFLWGVCVCVHSVAQSCLTLETCWTAAHQAPLSMGFFQKRILERVVISCFRGSSQSRGGTRVSHVSCPGRRMLHHCATREALLSLVSLTAFCWLPGEKLLQSVCLLQHIRNIFPFPPLDCHIATSS